MSTWSSRCQLHAPREAPLVKIVISVEEAFRIVDERTESKTGADSFVRGGGRRLIREPVCAPAQNEAPARTGQSLAELASAFPRYHQAKRNVDVEDARKDDAMRAVSVRLSEKLTEGRTRDVTVDGFKRVYDDHSWLLFRKSGTEPIIRVYSDAPTRERADALASAGEALLKEAL